MTRNKAYNAVKVIKSIVKSAKNLKLLPAYGRGFLPEDFDFRDALEAFQSYFVNN